MSNSNCPSSSIRVYHKVLDSALESEVFRSSLPYDCSAVYVCDLGVLRKACTM